MTEEKRKKIVALAGFLACSEYQLRGLLNTLDSVEGVVILQEELRKWAERRPLRLSEILTTESWLPTLRRNIV